MFLVALGLSMCVGCTESRTYTVSVKNLCAEPLTVGFVKHGGPLEMSWASPADMAIASPMGRLHNWGRVLPTGRKATTTIDGQFNPNAEAYLRVYRGEHSPSELMAMRPGTFDCVEVLLDESKNDYVIEDKHGRLSATPLGGMP